jgi:hypothetical protein
MQITGKFTATVEKYSNKVDGSNDGTTALADLSISCTQKQLADRLGAPMAAVVFAACVQEVVPSQNGDATETVWKLKNPAPSKKVVFEEHKMTIGDHTFTGQPLLLPFRPIEKSEKVLMRVRLQLGAAQKKLRRMLDEKMGNPIACVFAVSQEDLPGTN